MSQVPCPTCGSLKSRLAKKSERPDVWFNIKSFRKCEECGWVFEPPSGRALGGIVVLVGVCMIAAPLPGLIESLSPVSSKLIRLLHHRDGMLPLWLTAGAQPRHLGPAHRAARARVGYAPFAFVVGIGCPGV